MYNMRKYQQRSDQVDLLASELSAFDISRRDGYYEILIGDERLKSSTIAECQDHINNATNELRQHLWDYWKEIYSLASVILHNDAGNSGSMDNIFFINNVKRAYLLAKRFDDLKPVSDIVEQMFYIDAADIHEDLIEKFNKKFLLTKLLHHLVMREEYRSMLISRYMSVRKQAQISGPWANLDLPMKERVWSAAEDEEYFENRQKARREQTRYNPENNKMGFYFVWQDLTRDPYSFEDMKKDSPYKSRHLLTIP